MRAVTWPSLAAAIGLVCTVVALSCSDSEPETDRPAARQVTTPNLVTDGVIEGRQPGTPVRAFLQWWQAVQFADVEAFEELTALAAFREHSRKRMFAAVREVANSLGKPRIVATRRDSPGRATLRVFVQSLSTIGAVEAQSRYTFQLVRSPRGKWQIADLSYLESTYADLIRARNERTRR